MWDFVTENMEFGVHEGLDRVPMGRISLLL